MYALVETGGRQFRVEEGKDIVVDLMDASEGKKITLNKVLLIENGEGKTHIGAPYVKGAKVEATVLRHEQGKKIRVFKYKPKKRYRKTQGHRADYTRVKIEKITVGG